MKEIMLFYLERCPYCNDARRALVELYGEDSAYSTVRIHWIEERRERELADRYDYYYVPTIFYGEEKLYEAKPSEDYESVKSHIRAALDKVRREGEAS